MAWFCCCLSVDTMVSVWEFEFLVTDASEYLTQRSLAQKNGLSCYQSIEPKFNWKGPNSEIWTFYFSSNFNAFFFCEMLLFTSYKWVNTEIVLHLYFSSSLDMFDVLFFFEFILRVLSTGSITADFFYCGCSLWVELDCSKNGAEGNPCWLAAVVSRFA